MDPRSKVVGNTKPPPRRVKKRAKESFFFMKRSRPNQGGFNKRRLLEYGANAATKYIANRLNNYLGSGKSSANEVNTTQTGFLNFGDRGTQNQTYSKRKKGRKTKKAKRRLKKKRTFARKVKRVIKKRQGLKVYLEKTVVPRQITSSTTGVGTGSLVVGNQLVLGGLSGWMVNPGGAWGGTISTPLYLAGKCDDYNIVINGSIIAGPTAGETAERSSSFCRRTYCELTIGNTNDPSAGAARDLIFDLYECVAAANINDANYATPANTMYSCYTDVVPLTTGTAYSSATKGSEPWDYPRFGKFWTILKKQKVRIPYAEAVKGLAISQNYQTFRMYGPPLVYNAVKYNDTWAIKGKTKAFMMIIDTDVYRTRYVADEPVCEIFMHRKTRFQQLDNQLNPMAPSIASDNLYNNHSAASVL